MERPTHLTIIAWLTFVQGFMVTLVALLWFGIASYFSPDSSGITSPLMVMIAEAKGAVLVVLALLYLVFSVGAWRMRSWAWWVGLLASALSILYVVRAVLGGGSIIVGLFVLIIPLVLIWYLLSSTGRQIFGH
ncbi:MAG TPA: hypothetical protein VEI50_12400 [Nitrospiraceae bacterium]|nr:hypothetical protein [Nitrospiraceae bacterium]